MRKALKKKYGARKGRKIADALDRAGMTADNIGNAPRSFRTIEGEDIYQIVHAIANHQEEPVAQEESEADEQLETAPGSGEENLDDHE